MREGAPWAWRLFTTFIGLFLGYQAAASLVVWRFGADEAVFGRPLLGAWYNPPEVFGWATSWGFEPAYRGDFLLTLAIAGAIGLMPLALLELGNRMLERLL